MSRVATLPVRIRVRDSADADMAAITAIYSHHVAHGFASFEEVPPTEGEMAERRRRLLARGLPYLVAELDGDIGGYAYAGLYRERSAYRYTVEDSVYVADGWARRGLGAALLDATIARCAALGMRRMVAVIGDSANAASIGLHARLGFRVAGTLPSVGYKFGRWADSVIMVRALGEGDSTPPRD